MRVVRLSRNFEELIPMLLATNCENFIKIVRRAVLALS